VRVRDGSTPFPAHIKLTGPEMKLERGIEHTMNHYVPIEMLRREYRSINSRIRRQSKDEKEARKTKITPFPY